MIELIVFLLGTAFGSFAGTAIVRLPQNLSLIKPRSFCHHCNHRLDMADLVPVLSWLCLNRCCRYCHAPITIGYSLLEFVSGILMVVLYKHFGMQGEFIKVAVLLYFLLVIALIDLSYQLILHNTVVYMAGFGIAIRVIESWFNGTAVLMEAGLACLASGGIMALIFFLSRGGMGWGDVVFTAILGLWMNIELVLLTIFLAFVLGGVCGLFLMVSGHSGRKTHIPFAPFLAGAAMLSLLYGQDLIVSYKMVLL